MKNCPICSVEMEEKVLEGGLPAFTCSVGHGIWISAVDYQDWVTIDRLYPLPDIDKVKALRKWLHNHPNGNRLLAYLIDKDPYKG